MLRKLDAFLFWVRSHPFLDFVFDLVFYLCIAGLGAEFAILMMP